MFEQDITFDQLFTRTRLALEIANGNPLSDGIKTEQKILTLLAAQLGENNAFELTKAINAFQKFSIAKLTPEQEIQRKDKEQAAIERSKHDEVLRLEGTKKQASTTEEIKIVADYGNITVDTLHHKNGTTTFFGNKNTLNVPRDIADMILDKLPMESLYKLLGFIPNSETTQANASQAKQPVAINGYQGVSKTQLAKELNENYDNSLPSRIQHAKQQTFLQNTVKHALTLNSIESAVAYIEGELAQYGSLDIANLIVADWGRTTLDTFKVTDNKHKVIMQGKSFIVPDGVKNKLSQEELFDFLGHCVPQADAKELDLQLGLSKISLEHKTRHLISCEKALEESESRDPTGKTWLENNTVVPMVITCMIDFFYHYQEQINTLLADGQNIYDALNEEISDYFQSHRDVLFEADGNLQAVINGLHEPKLSNVDLNICYEQRPVHPSSLMDFQIRVYGYAFEELIKDTLIGLATTLIHYHDNNPMVWSHEEIVKIISVNKYQLF
jgi:hypothetical protein